MFNRAKLFNLLSFSYFINWFVNCLFQLHWKLFFFTVSVGIAGKDETGKGQERSARGEDEVSCF